MTVVDLLRTEDGLAWRRLHMGKARLREARGTSFILGAFSMVSLISNNFLIPETISSFRIDYEFKLYVNQENLICT
jgi:hypothetical protein